MRRIFFGYISFVLAADGGREQRNIIDVFIPYNTNWLAVSMLYAIGVPCVSQICDPQFDIQYKQFDTMIHQKFANKEICVRVYAVDIQRRTIFDLDVNNIKFQI